VGGNVPLETNVLAWEEFHTGLKRLEERAQEGHIPTECLMRPVHVQPLQLRRPTSRLPQILGEALSNPNGAAKTGPTAGIVALTLTPADYRLLNVVACHPFLSRDKLATVLGWPLDTVVRRKYRLVDHGLIRLVEPDETGADANLQLVELTRVGLELVAAYRGLSLSVAVREIGFAGGGTNDPIGARTKLLRNLAHTLGVDELFGSLYGTARRLTEAGSDDAMLEWQNATACTRRHLRPDGYGIYRRNGRRFGFFLEFDRGTMNRRDYFRKFSAYYDYATTRRFDRDYNGYPTILIVTTRNGAEERMARVAQAISIGRSVALPLFLTCRWRTDAPTNADGLLGRIWRKPTADFEDRHSWLPAPARAIQRRRDFI
jgi:hypothetical protein